MNTVCVGKTLMSVKATSYKMMSSFDKSMYQWDHHCGLYVSSVFVVSSNWQMIYCTVGFGSTQ